MPKYFLHASILAGAISLLLGSLLQIGCCQMTHQPAQFAQKSDPATAEPKLPFYLGADVSALAGGRGGPATYTDTNGAPGSEIAIMATHKWNAFRLRVFVSPVRSAPNNSLENTIPIAKQIKAAGATFLLDIHYSDTWADPQHQEIPVAWRSLTTEQLEKQVEDYTKDVLAQFNAADAMPDMVQVGNEITGGMLWPLGHVRVPPSTVKTDAGRIQPLPDPYDDATQWANLIRFIKAGARGVRAATADHPVKIVLHIDCGGDWPITQWYFDHITAGDVDYDIIGQSFYPNYHGTLALMQQNAIQTYAHYHKPVMIAETGYAQTGGPAITERKYMQWPGTPEGQLQFMADLVNTAKRDPHILGVFYWAPEGRGRGNALWTTAGAPTPALLVMDHLNVSTQPGNQMPPKP